MPSQQHGHRESTTKTMRQHKLLKPIPQERSQRGDEEGEA